jgi:GNAT superfamily N-acetyltransferase
MKNTQNPTNKFEIKKSDLKEVNSQVKSHVKGLAFPMDSWLEDSLMNSITYKLMCGNKCIGYAAVLKKTLQFFHVRKRYFRYAPTLFEQLLTEKAVKKVFITSGDSLLCALIAEWEYKKEKQACFFTDNGRVENPDTLVTNGVFRVAAMNDVKRIRQVSGKFFDEPSCGFTSLEERIKADTIFVLEDKKSLLGCGIVEKGVFYPDCVSIGMFVNRKYRGKGCATTILLKLKEWAYQHDLKPVAGCWYYNTLSRKSLEAAGMTATSIGFQAILKGKEKPPLRTGNPPGELVAEK